MKVSGIICCCICCSTSDIVKIYQKPEQHWNVPESSDSMRPTIITVHSPDLYLCKDCFIERKYIKEENEK